MTHDKYVPPEQMLYDWLSQVMKDEASGRLYIGIDPGVSGAIGFIWSGVAQFCLAIDIPVTQIHLTAKNKSGKSKVRARFNTSGIRAIFDVIKPLRGLTSLLLEESITMGHDSKIVVQSVTMGFYIWPLYLEEIGIPLETIAPNEWKKAYGILKWDKGRILTAARRKFTGADLRLEKHHNRAEALCLANFLCGQQTGRPTGFVQSRQRKKR